MKNPWNKIPEGVAIVGIGIGIFGVVVLFFFGFRSFITSHTSQEEVKAPVTETVSADTVRSRRDFDCSEAYFNYRYKDKPSDELLYAFGKPSFISELDSTKFWVYDKSIEDSNDPGEDTQITFVIQSGVVKSCIEKYYGKDQNDEEQ